MEMVDCVLTVPVVNKWIWNLGCTAFWKVGRCRDFMAGNDNDDN